jgi:hypothetical protein
MAVEISEERSNLGCLPSWRVPIASCIRMAAWLRSGTQVIARLDSGHFVLGSTPVAGRLVVLLAGGWKTIDAGVGRETIGPRMTMLIP